MFRFPRPPVLFGVLVLLMLAPAAIAQQDPALFFRQNCMSCHTIGGGRLVGPDLKNVEQQKDRAWLVRFVTNPKQVLDSGDPYALKLREEARGAVMPQISGMNDVLANQLLDMIAKESKLPQSQFSGLTLGDQPFTALDVQHGYEIFTGKRHLTNGGAQCISCHTVQGIGGLGGGQVGPDLTRVFERLNGRKNLAAWLQAPATPTMRPVFMTRALTNDEIVALVAYFENAAKQPTNPDDPTQLGFLFLGIGGAAVGFVTADALWRKRFRAVRRPMTRGEK